MPLIGLWAIGLQGMSTQGSILSLWRSQLLWSIRPSSVRLAGTQSGMR